MTTLSALELLLRAGLRAVRPGADHGGISPPALAVTVLVLLLAAVIVATGAHEIVLAALRDAWDAIVG